MSSSTFFPRDLSWLSFNERVLQEAEDKTNPLLERLKFLAIYSSNLDEFYRVRVANHRSLMALKSKTKTKFGLTPEETVSKINEIVDAQQNRFGEVFWNEMVPKMKAEGLHLAQIEELDEAQIEWLETYFNDNVKGTANTISLDDKVPFLEDQSVYFLIKLKKTVNPNDPRHFFLKLPYSANERFVVIPTDDKRLIVQLDDIIRHFAGALFPEREVQACWAVKLSRDADLHLEDEFEGSVADKIAKSLSKRLTGTPTRLLYDSAMPDKTVKLVRKWLGLKKFDMVAGGRYHNFSHFFGLPTDGFDQLKNEDQAPLSHPTLTGADDPLAVIREGDVLLNFPYQTYSDVIRILDTAADDPNVTSIAITLYRVASDSAVGKALERAAKNGKKVTAFIEVQARFDEESNLFWGNRLSEVGVNVLYSYEQLKVHTKLFVFERNEGEIVRRYAYLGTGNFNEKTARIYGDHAILTCHDELCQDVMNVFAYLLDRSVEQTFKHLFVAPMTLRNSFEQLIEREMAFAAEGKPASMTLKMNSLEDKAMIEKLYAASNAGVKIKLIIRGICSLVPGVEGQSENIEIRSIVDRYLEHARIYYFNNGGAPQMYVASADWMTRNLSRRVEVAFPVLDDTLRTQLEELLDLQWADNVKARAIDAEQRNEMISTAADPVRAQYAIYEVMKKMVT